MEFNSEIMLMNKAIYIDNPFVLDDLDLHFFIGINPIENSLFSLLNKKKEENDVLGTLLNKETLNKVYSKLQSVVNGNICLNNKSEYCLQEEEINEPISFRNLSTGMKSFVLLQMLLEKDILKERDILILDEPEIHLHPEWQIVYAELIVLLQKYFDLSIIVATHSPYFVDAINLYSIKHGIDKDVNYYLTKQSDKVVELKDVTSNIDKIYAEMASPISLLETLRYELNNKE